MSEPVLERPRSKIDVLREVALRYADADTDEDFRRADENLVKASARAAYEAVSERIRRGIAERRARGERVGRAPKVEPERAARLAARVGVAKAAALLGISQRTVYRALSETGLVAGRCLPLAGSCGP